ncbi:preprotein translocase subunit YajC [Halodesulfovibrio marinisediminis]|uniref:Sec translocon accessory complex subunit YajC n=1 Tax=Halodesulfovibrio marinisediminis DSM 17456 TaxID=1121457 RepID=A0A1N6I565_9BACT|nr:preprotein translocase subunit YajC [Halodesulfovibrio marinisediminis]SIO27174.1 protein translocase subunit yajC [Halodesulfovibrio marinisediminis DSM 17456]
MFFPEVAWAMGTAGGQAGDGNPIAAFVPLALMFVIFYFLLIRPQQKRAKEHKALLDNLQKGQSVVTAGGLIGTIVAIKDDIISIDLGDTTVQVGRQYISGLKSSPAAEKTTKKK